jgi:hypothetical protein
MRIEGVFGVRTMGVCDDRWALRGQKAKGVKTRGLYHVP